jgi:multidrug transporter EmrE-like cation transporter
MYGMIIPSLAGPIFWKENIGALQIVGICIMVASLWLLKDTPKEGQEKSKSIKSLALALVAFVLSGMAGVMEKIHQSTDGRSEKTTFVLVACLFMLAFSIIAYFIIKPKERENRIIPKALYPFSSISGLIVGFYSITNLTLAGALDSMIYYPIANGGAMLLTVVVSLCIFKERANVSKIIGMALGLCGILLLSLPI